MFEYSQSSRSNFQTIGLFNKLCLDLLKQIKYLNFVISLLGHCSRGSGSGCTANRTGWNDSRNHSEAAGQSDSFNARAQEARPHRA